MNVERFALPADAHALARDRLDAVVDVRHLRPLARRADPHLRRLGERLAHDRRLRAVRARRHAHHAGGRPRRRVLVARPDRRIRTRLCINRRDLRLPLRVRRGEHRRRTRPAERRHRARDRRRDVARRSTGGRHDVQVAARRRPDRSSSRRCMRSPIRPATSAARRAASSARRCRASHRSTHRSPTGAPPTSCCPRPLGLTHRQEFVVR